VLTYSGEGPGENGKLTKMKTTSEMKDKDTVVFKMYSLQLSERFERSAVEA
jgi:hypothetical protein